jgi:trk system potassium uptake protein TrkA
MQINILGAGSVGFLVAEYFSKLHHEVFVIDSNLERLEYLQDHLDVQIISGEGTDLDVLHKAHLSECDLFFALTERDEINLIACKLAKHLKVPFKVARLNENFHLKPQNLKTFKSLGVDEVLNTEEIIIEEIISGLNYPNFRETKFFFNEQIALILIANTKEFDFLKSVKEIHETNEVKIFTLHSAKAEIANYEFNNAKNAESFIFICHKDKIPKIEKKLFPQSHKPKKAVIYGSGYKSEETCLKLADACLEIGITNVEILLEDIKQAEKLSRKSDYAFLIEDPLKPMFIKSESIKDKDVFIAISANFEKNLFACLIAAQKEIPLIFGLARYPEHINFTNKIPIKAMINPAIVSANKIMKLHKSSAIIDFSMMNFGSNFCLHFKISKESNLISLSPQKVGLKNSKIAAIKRDNQLFTPNGDYQFMAKDEILAIVVSEEKDFLQSLI